MVKKIEVDNKRVLNNIIGAFSVKGLGLLINFFTIPMYMRYFENNSILGVWYTILSILTWIVTFDLGIGNGLRNHIVEAYVKKDTEEIKTYLSSAYIILGVVSIVLLVVCLVAVFILDLNSIFNISNEIISLKNLRFAFGISIIGIAGQFFLKLILSVLNAMEKTALSNVVMLVSNVINLLYLMICNGGTDTNKLIVLSLVYSFSINLPLLICTIIVFLTALKGMVPSLYYYQRSYAYKILNLGGSFFFIQVLFMIITSSNEFFISNVFGADKVVEYQVYNKIFYTCVTLYSLISNPIWSAVTRAWKENRIDWIKKIYQKLLLSALTGVIGIIFLCYIFQFVVNLWLGSNTITVEQKYVLAFAVYISVLFFVFAINSIANGLQSLRPQMICYLIAVVIKIGLIIGLGSLWKDWSIVIWVNSLTLVAYVIWQAIEIRNKLAQYSD